MTEVLRPKPAPPPRPADCAADVLDVMPAVMDAMRSAMRQQVGEQLSVPQYRCLNFIDLQPGSSVSAVAAFLGVTLPTASAMIDRLVRAGAVAPRTAVQDRRRSELHVTAAGFADGVFGHRHLELAFPDISCRQRRVVDKVPMPRHPDVVPHGDVVVAGHDHAHVGKIVSERRGPHYGDGEVLVDRLGIGLGIEPTGPGGLHPHR